MLVSDGSAQMHHENRIVQGFQRLAVAIFLNPFQGLKPRDEHLGQYNLRVAIFLNPFQGLKLRGSLRHLKEPQRRDLP